MTMCYMLLRNAATLEPTSLIYFLSFLGQENSEVTATTIIDY